MRITIVNTSDSRGGAAIAALRLFKSLYKILPQTRMLVREKLTETPGIVGLSDTGFKRFKSQLQFLFERLSFIPRAKSKDFWFAFSPANIGQSITDIPEIKDADIIHLHWIHMGFLSINDIQNLVKTGKPIVWSLHDMWVFTGGCHYAGSCTNFMKSCGNCALLAMPSNRDFSYRIHKKKLRHFDSANINFIAVSNWMAENARKSSLIGRSRITVLPNPIDTEIYKPANKIAIREKLGLPKDRFLILSGAANLKDKRKGFAYLVDALSQIARNRPGISDKYGLISFGKSSEVELNSIPVFAQSYLKDDKDIAKLYQAADVFVLPTMEDNLPSTVMEALACGTPVVAFNTGGIPDMVEHKKNGYLAELRNVDDLISGIEWIENHSEIEQIRNNARQKVLMNFSMDVVTEKYVSFYKDLLR
jgi:glycosyltransferase involved in cell wall biosynthesis